MNVVDPERTAAVIAEIAEAEIMSRFGKLDASDIREKSGPADLVTAADEAAERALRIALHDIRPDAAFVGEEVATREPSVMQAIGSEGSVWIVDPLDGTRNFIRGVREFGVIVALVVKGRTQAGWIYAAPERETAIAVAGDGASWKGVAIKPKFPSPGKPKGLRSVGWLDPERQVRVRAALSQHFETAPGHCSAYAYIKLARGEIDFKISSRVHPWDHAAGAVLLQEVGGRVAWLDEGREYGPTTSRDAPLLGVAPFRQWDDLAAYLNA